MLHVEKFDMARALVSGLQAMGIYEQIVDSPIGPKRLDAGETAVMSRELEHVFAEVYRKEFPGLVGRALVPSKPGVPSGAESHTYTEVERRGEAKIIHNYATDFPSTEVSGSQFSDVIRGIGGSYHYSIQDLRAAALTKIKMPTEKAEAARESMENKLDDLVLNGDAATGLKGLNSSALVTNYNLVTSDVTNGANGLWSAATPAKILHDVLAMFKAVSVATKGTRRADTLVLDSASWNHIAFTFIPDGAGSITNTTILTWLMANVPGLRSIELWNRLDHAGASNKSRIFAFQRSPEVLYQVLPQDFEQMPPQARGMAFAIMCHMRWGGVVCPRPKAVAYLDGSGFAS